MLKISFFKKVSTCLFSPVGGKGLSEAVNHSKPSKLVGDVLEFKSLFHEFLANKGLSNHNLDMKVFSSIKHKNFVGEGIKAKVYSLADDYVTRIPKANNITDELVEVKGQKFSPIFDNLEGRNFGQAIAETENGISIAKKVSGTPLYSNSPNPWISYLPGAKNYGEIGPKEAKAFYSQLKELSKLPNESISQYIDDILFLQKKGYSVDLINPNNFHFDKACKKINILYIKKKEMKNLSDLDLLKPLVNKMFLEQNYKHLSPTQRKESIEIIRDLAEKCTKIGDRKGITKEVFNPSKTFPNELPAMLKAGNNIEYKIDDLTTAVSNVIYK